MRAPGAGWLAAMAAVSMLGWGRAGRADLFDLALQRLVTPPSAGQGAAPLPMPDQVAYRQLVSELGTVLAPQFLAPADTIGSSGYQFTFDAGFTSISNQACQPSEQKDRCPWATGASGVDGQGNRRTLPGYASTISVTARKGIWLPLPSFEIGAGATKLLQSDLYTAMIYAKFALHEGYHDWPIPSLSLRGSVVRLLGSSQIDMTMAQVDAEVSKSFGLFGTVTFVPYFGAAALMTIARGQVLDTTPAVDAYRFGPSSADLNNNAVFPDQDTIVRWRFFIGFRLNYSILVLAADWAITACGDFTGSPSGECNHAGKSIADNAATQNSFNLSVGFLF